MFCLIGIVVIYTYVLVGVNTKCHVVNFVTRLQHGNFVFTSTPQIEKIHRDIGLLDVRDLW